MERLDDIDTFTARLMIARLNKPSHGDSPQLRYDQIGDRTLRTDLWVGDFLAASSRAYFTRLAIDLNSERYRFLGNPDPEKIVAGLKGALRPSEVIKVVRVAKGWAADSFFLNGDKKGVLKRFQNMIREERALQSVPNLARKSAHISRQVENGLF